MSWATHAIDALKRGETQVIRPRGHSMTGRVDDGNYVTVAPCEPATPKVGDIILVRVKGNDYLHLVKAIDKDRFQIGNNKGGINGWVGHQAIYGKAVSVSVTKPESLLPPARPVSQ